jgi:NRAMP (natural resistance-associated macrophage protein)-like metal ion transporter
MKKFGPGLLVTAAFIGPGTVTTASVAGASYGFALLWALLFSVAATIILQEMAARLGLVTGGGLSEALRGAFRTPLLNALAVVLVVCAITLGNAAFETGNITGAALGLEVLSGQPAALWSLLVGGTALALLAMGGYRVIERVLIALVLMMSLVFLLTMLLVGPDPGAMLGGMFTPSIPDGSLVTIVALIGTTVVPYNLFLHSNAVREKWRGDPLPDALRAARLDSLVSISLGGLITLAVVATAASAFFSRGASLESAAVMAEQLEPLLGAWAKYFFAAGLLAAGITSAITAPLAAAYATAGAMGWEKGLRDPRARGVWIVIILVGTALAVTGTRPVAAIIFAQAANGLLLPLVAGFLLLVMNRGEVLGAYRNRLASNLAGGLVVAVAAGLGGFQLLRVFGAI